MKEKIFEDLYGVQGHEGNKKYRIIPTDNLEHRIPGERELTHLGVGYTSAFYGIIEQQIGKDIYHATANLQISYVKLVSAIKTYNKANSKISTLSNELQSAEKAVAKAIKELNDIDAELDYLHQNPQKATNLKLQLDVLTNRRIKAVADFTKYDQNRQQIKNQLLLVKLDRNEFYMAILDSHDDLEAIIQEVKKVDLTKLDRFSNPAFEKEVIEDYVASCVLPDHKQKRYDNNVFRTKVYGEAEYERARLEAECIKETYDEAQALLQELSVAKKPTISEERALKADLLAQKWLFSNGIIETVPAELDSINANRYYRILAEEIRGIQSGEDVYLPIKNDLESGKTIYEISNREYSLPTNEDSKQPIANHAFIYNEPFMKIYNDLEKLKQLQAQSTRQNSQSQTATMEDGKGTYLSERE